MPRIPRDILYATYRIPLNSGVAAIVGIAFHNGLTTLERISGFAKKTATHRR